jgi:hypothetical protein
VADAVGWKVLVFTISYSPHDVEVTVDANLLPYCSTSFNNLEIGKSRSVSPKIDWLSLVVTTNGGQLCFKHQEKFRSLYGSNQ